MKVVFCAHSHFHLIIFSCRTTYAKNTYLDSLHYLLNNECLRCCESILILIFWYSIRPFRLIEKRNHWYIPSFLYKWKCLSLTLCIHSDTYVNMDIKMDKSKWPLLFCFDNVRIIMRSHLVLNMPMAVICTDIYNMICIHLKI